MSLKLVPTYPHIEENNGIVIFEIDMIRTEVLPNQFKVYFFATIKNPKMSLLFHCNQLLLSGKQKQTAQAFVKN